MYDMDQVELGFQGFASLAKREKTSIDFLKNLFPQW